MQTTILSDISPSRDGAGLPPPHKLTLRDKMVHIRNRLLTNPRFIKFAETFPLTRPRARREASALFDICSGFVYSQVLVACAKLRVFETLREGGLSPSELALRVGLSDEAMEKLLCAAKGLRLVEPSRNGTITLGVLGAAYLASPGLGAMVEHHTLLYRDLADPLALLGSASSAGIQSGSDGGAKTSTNLAKYWPYAGANASPANACVASYTSLMAATQPAIASEILDAVRLNRRCSLMDVGGGDGTFLSHVAKRAPHIDLTLFDLPAVTDVARARFETAAMKSRIAIHSGDFRRDALPRGSDTITLIRILLDHDDQICRALLRSVREALPTNGLLIIAEAMADVRGVEKVAAYFSFYLIAMGKGRPRTEARFREMLLEAGFRNVTRASTRQPLLTQILLARP